MSRPIRRVKRPVRKVAKPPVAKKACPSCGGSKVRISTVVGEELELVISRWCSDCRHMWKTRTKRTDICEHGTALIVPCERCGRTWETIES